ncbi:MAG: hypothetical protein ABL897_03405 [Hyphomicrobium sp.]
MQARKRSIQFLLRWRFGLQQGLDPPGNAGFAHWRIKTIDKRQQAFVVELMPNRDDYARINGTLLLVARPAGEHEVASALPAARRQREKMISCREDSSISFVLRVGIALERDTAVCTLAVPDLK